MTGTAIRSSRSPQNTYVFDRKSTIQYDHWSIRKNSESLRSKNEGYCQWIIISVLTLKSCDK